jgi:hypothetical protein
MNRVLIISPDAETRSHLYQVASEVPEFGEIATSNSIKETLTNLAKALPFRYVFISSGFDRLEIGTFIEQSRRTRAGRSSTYIIILKPEEQDMTSVANSMVLGAHGFLCEPFSVDAVSRISRLSRDVNTKGSFARLKAATGLMLSEFLSGENLSDENVSAADQKNLWDRVQDTYRRYRLLTGESLSGPVIQHVQNTTPEQRLRLYTGVSERVRKLVENIFFKSVKKPDGALSPAKETAAKPEAHPEARPPKAG